MANGIVKYTSKDYDSIVTDLTDSISSLTNLWTSREDSDPGIVLLKCMAALGDMLSYNFDKQSLEYYAQTVTQRKNAYRLFELIGYHMKWYTAAMTTVNMTYSPQVPEYISYYQQVYNAQSDDEIVNIYYNYRNKYKISSSTPERITYDSIAVPPVTSPSYQGVLTELPIPSKMIEAYPENDPRTFIEIGIEGNDINGNQVIDPTQFPLSEAIKGYPKFIEHATTIFAEKAREVYKYWLEDVEPFGLHTHINDSARTLSLYSDVSGSIPYSIIPSIDNGKIEGGLYLPTVFLEPFKPTPIKAIQGVLKSTTFSSTQVRNNKFYIPESDIDDTYMWVSYVTNIQGNEAQTPIFFKKSDNLLMESQVTTEDIQGNDFDEKATYSDTTIYFQFKIDDYDYPYIEFSSYWQDILGNADVLFTFYYFKTLGRYGNITTNYLKRLSNLSNQIYITNTDTNTSVYNENGDLLSYPGRNQESAADAYVNSLNYVMTYDTLVTIFDFERYTKRQSGISNALAVDNQRAHDINNALLQECESYSIQQLKDILGIESDSKSDLVKYLFNARKVVYDYKNAPVSKEDAETDIDTGSRLSDGGFKNYSLHMYPVYSNFGTIMDSDKNIAKIFNEIETDSETKSLPYKLYKIYTQDDVRPDTNVDDSIAVALDNSYRNCHIVNVEPSYTALRVFPWRCCGVIHLTKSVTKHDAKMIVKNVIDHIRNTYTSYTQQFGKKISYMDLIQVILEADTRIRYFDAGLGDKKLIEFQNVSNNPEDYFNVQAYFNAESLMMYAQSEQDNSQEGGPYFNWISVDPMYIQK